MGLKKYAAHRRYYARYLVRDWNRAHPPDEALEALWMYFIREDTGPEGPAPTRRMKVFARRYGGKVATSTTAGARPPM